MHRGEVERLLEVLHHELPVRGDVVGDASYRAELVERHSREPRRNFAKRLVKGRCVRRERDEDEAEGDLHAHRHQIGHLGARLTVQLELEAVVRAPKPLDSTLLTVEEGGATVCAYGMERTELAVVAAHHGHAG